MSLVLLSLLLGLSFSSLIQDNVLFKKRNEFAVTRSQWLVTFVIDFKPYKQFLSGLAETLHSTKKLLINVQQRYQTSEKLGHLRPVLQLRADLDMLQNTQESLQEQYTNYQYLGARSKSRTERSLLPFIGRGLSFLFGTVSQSELRTIRRQINVLASNQDNIVHIVDEQMSVLNVSRKNIMENRKSINKIITSLGQLETKFDNLTFQLVQEINDLSEFVQTLAQINLQVDHVRRLVQNAVLYFEHMRLELSMLALGHLSPDTISPNELATMLFQIKNQLPRSLKLPENPTRRLWKYYKILQCDSALEDDRILVFVTIPLLDNGGRYIVYEIHNLPLPFITNKQPAITLPKMVAKFKLEHFAIAVNSERTRYIPLTQTELQTCGDISREYCPVQGAVFPINLSRLCVIALFMKNERHINSYCGRMVLPNTILPYAEYLGKGMWAVVSETTLRFMIVCHNHETRNSDVIIKPPMGIIELGLSCSASNDFITLLPYFQRRSEMQIHDSLDNVLKSTNFSNVRIWEPIIKTLSNVTAITLPPEHGDMDQIPMDRLISKIKQPLSLRLQNGVQLPLSLIIAIVTSVTTFLFIISVCLCYFRTKIIRKLAMFSGSDIKQSTPTGPSAEADTGVRSVSTEGVRTYLRASLPPSPKEDGKSIVRHLYPKLDFSTTEARTMPSNMTGPVEAE